MPGADGTTITVRDIFLQYPARMKFTQEGYGGGNAVAGVFGQIALSHPESPSG